MTTTVTDPMELIMRGALDRAGLRYTTDQGGGNAACLDFHLTDFNIHIEVKQFHTPRVAEQMSRVSNVIVAQGREAVEWLAVRIESGGKR